MNRQRRFEPRSSSDSNPGRPQIRTQVHRPSHGSRAADIEMSADHVSSGGPRFERPTLSWERDFSLFELAAVRSGKSCVGVMVIKTFLCGYCINLLFWADAMSSDLPNPSAARGTRPRAGRRRSCPSCSRHQCWTRVPCRGIVLLLSGRGGVGNHQPIGTATTAAFSHGRWRRHRSAKVQGGEVQSYATAHVSRSGSALLVNFSTSPHTPCL